jgi:phage tail sheath protein FI
MEILSPKVYFEEKPGGLNLIAGAGTALVLFVGLVKASSSGLKVTPISNYTEFVTIYGGGVESALYGPNGGAAQYYLPYAVKHFFAEGGTNCYVLNLNVGGNAQHFGDAVSLMLSHEEITLICYPDSAGDATFTTQLADVCTKLNAFAIIDASVSADHLTDATHLERFSALAANKMMGVYYPWVKVPNSDSAGGLTVDVPPSCVVAGIFARNDGERGVHKAPAGISSGLCHSVLGVKTTVSEIEHDTFIKSSTQGAGIKVNIIRPIPGVGTCVWGARTWSADSDIYINVTRLEAYIKDSLREGLMWVTFKPNNQELWGQVNRSITAFMRRLWQEGALFGAKEEQAFKVIVDNTNNTGDTMPLGELHITLMYAPVKPAEFVILTFTQKTS